jgi:hypothetical protein
MENVDCTWVWIILEPRLRELTHVISAARATARPQLSGQIFNDKSQMAT